MTSPDQPKMGYYLWLRPIYDQPNSNVIRSCQPRIRTEGLRPRMEWPWHSRLINLSAASVREKASQTSSCESLSKQWSLYEEYCPADERTQSSFDEGLFSIVEVIKKSVPSTGNLRSSQMRQNCSQEDASYNRGISRKLESFTPGCRRQKSRLQFPFRADHAMIMMMTMMMTKWGFFPAGTIFALRGNCP